MDKIEIWIYFELIRLVLKYFFEESKDSIENKYKVYKGRDSDISEDELIELLKPKFDRKPVTSRQIYNQPGVLIITTSNQEINELNSPEPEPSTLK